MGKKVNCQQKKIPRWKASPVQCPRGGAGHREEKTRTKRGEMSYEGEGGELSIEGKKTRTVKGKNDKL